MIRPRKTDWVSSPITTKIADAYFGFIVFVLKMALAAVLGVVLYGSGRGLIGIDSFIDASHSFNLDHRLRPEMLRTAMATAFF